MKTRKRIHAAFAHPDISWSRKRSVMIVKRIQIQITKRKISTTTRSSSPKLMSARGTLLPFEKRWLPTLVSAVAKCSFTYERGRCTPNSAGTLEYHRVEDGSDRGGEVEAGYPGPH